MSDIQGRSERKKIRVVAAVVEREGRYLITQRREQAVLALLWEFPGGRVEAGERDEDALKRELRERLDADAVVGRKLGERSHAYERYDVEVALYETRLGEERPLVPRRVRDFRWVASSEFENYPFPDADQSTMDQLLGIDGDARGGG